MGNMKTLLKTHCVFTKTLCVFTKTLCVFKTLSVFAKYLTPRLLGQGSDNGMKLMSRRRDVDSLRLLPRIEVALIIDDGRIPTIIIAIIIMMNTLQT
jgi:hypothetical protein